MSDLITVIEDAWQDAQTPEAAPVEASTEASTDTSTNLGSSYATEAEVSPESPVEGSTEPSTDIADSSGSTSTEVASPSNRQGAQTDPNLDNKFGIPSHTNGRENRIPYSRVKEIVKGAEKRAIEPLTKELNELRPLRDLNKQYEERLTAVGQFEQILTTDVEKSLQMLSTLPAWRPFFEQLNQLASGGTGATQPTAAGAAPRSTMQDSDPMPQPTEDDGQGGKVYSMQGVQDLMAWTARQAKQQTLSEVEKTYAPLKQEYEAQQRYNKLVPVVNAQIAEARKWEKFNENEAEIVKFLNENPTASLETAYRQVVVPKLRTDVTAIRKQVMAELQQRPVASTSVAPGATRPGTQTPAPGTRNMEDVIRQAMQENNLR